MCDSSVSTKGNGTAVGLCSACGSVLSSRHGVSLPVHDTAVAAASSAAPSSNSAVAASSSGEAGEGGASRGDRSRSPPNRVVRAMVMTAEPLSLSFLESTPWFVQYQSVIEIEDTQPDPEVHEVLTTQEDSPQSAMQKAQVPDAQLQFVSLPPSAVAADVPDPFPMSWMHGDSQDDTQEYDSSTGIFSDRQIGESQESPSIEFVAALAQTQQPIDFSQASIA